jgi:SMI1/KNR4 family protein SUKH-1/HNH/ENDO VII superfamily nuclease
MPIGSSAAGRILHLKPPPLRLRYRHGVYVDLRGYPDWHPYAAALATVPAAPPDLSADEARVLGVVTANRLLALACTHTGAAPDGAPPGWVWAHLGRSDTLALVPAELHGAFRHRGGAGDRPATETTGIRDAGPRVPIRPTRTVALEAVQKFEDWLGGRLPDGYREFLSATNGGAPTRAAVTLASGLLLDQPLFGLAAQDRMHDLAYANLWLRDRLTADFLAIGYVQGGLLVLQVRGTSAGSVWHWDDDDRQDDERYGPDVICRDLLRPCAADMAAFVEDLVAVPAGLGLLADEAVRSETARLVQSADLGAALPRSHRSAWVSQLTSASLADRSGPPR